MICKKIIVFIISINFFGCLVIKECDTSNKPDERWESLPILVSTVDFDIDIAADAILIFNEYTGINAFEMDYENPKLIISFGILENDIYGSTTTKSRKKDNITHKGTIEISDAISDDLIQTTLLHELGHALGKKSHDENGLMYCYSRKSHYNDKEMFSLFENLNEWISENYPEY